MPRIRNLLFLLIIVGFIWFRYGDNYQTAGIDNVWQEMQSDFQAVKESPVVTSAVNNIRFQIERLYSMITDDQEEISAPPQVETPKLDQPDKQRFSIHNVEITDTKDEVEKLLGEAKRTSINEYGVEWHTYHEQYQNFIMVAYNSDNQVAGLFTNQDLIRSTSDIRLGSTKDEVNNQLDEPLDSIQKGFVKYRINDDSEQDTYLIDENYVTIFYDVHQNNSVAAVQIISKQLENQKEDYFAKASSDLADGLEYQLFDLTNAARTKFEQPLLDWHEESRNTAENHSKDMAVQNYFSHTNLDGQSPFDRLEEDNITFRMAGENLAAGQSSSIFAHQGLMNSKGHRENILKSEFRLMSVGVAFNEDDQPFYTETYLTK
ncbi:CAP domain-containing protein [Gracilibacillus kekensis]|uniref:Cysteine-rich secretory protein family protein n=1 Tax=Gracilibacillus kekensis TaxID=1027249 RepID=A0A1M7PMM8_9BACI|nr:CAP domain-containing protein [Gracilibacillus kekensis]SHN18456.1 Cysteine-rich secretory protein family protein [Gracilibacillus kekensis]